MLRTIRKLKNEDIRNKRILLRVDFNVPQDKNGNISDDRRIISGLLTIRYLLKKGAKQIIVMTHLGRPDGKSAKKLKVDRIAERLSKLLKKPVKKLDDCINLKLKDTASDGRYNNFNRYNKFKIVMLENLRFYKQEEDNDKTFAKKLSSLADIYVNDAFAVSHRKHASVHAITYFLPSYAGLLLEDEITSIENILKKPKRPFIAVIGGVKFETKIPVMEHILKKTDMILVGGAMAFTFFRAFGAHIGRSIYEKEYVRKAYTIFSNARKRIILPADVLIADRLNEKADVKNVYKADIIHDWYGIDIGEGAVTDYTHLIKNAKTIVWNGPMGMAEIRKFSNGTRKIALAIANSKAVTLVGGADTLSLIDELKLENKFTHISTGGGAFLEFIAGKKLPGIEVLRK